MSSREGRQALQSTPDSSTVCLTHPPRLAIPDLAHRPLSCSGASDDDSASMDSSSESGNSVQVVPQRSVLDALLLGEWEDRAEAGLFRYDVTACPTKLVPGSYGFIAQCNEGRLSKKRPTEFRIDQVRCTAGGQQQRGGRVRRHVHCSQPPLSTHPTCSLCDTAGACAARLTLAALCTPLCCRWPRTSTSPSSTSRRPCRRRCSSCSSPRLGAAPSPPSAPQRCLAPPRAWSTSTSRPSSTATCCWCPAPWTAYNSSSPQTRCCWPCSLPGSRVSS